MHIYVQTDLYIKIINIFITCLLTGHFINVTASKPRVVFFFLIWLMSVYIVGYILLPI